MRFRYSAISSEAYTLVRIRKIKGKIKYLTRKPTPPTLGALGRHGVKSICQRCKSGNRLRRFRSLGSQSGVGCSKSFLQRLNMRF